MRLRTIGLISTLALGLLAGSWPAEAQQAGKVYRIGYLGGGSPGILRRIKSKPPPHYIAFWQGLRELGYVEEQNLRRPDESQQNRALEFAHGNFRGIDG